MTSSRTVPVVVVAAHDGPLMHSPLGVARSLGGWGVPVHVVHPRGRTPASWSRWVRSTTALRLDPSDPQTWLSALCRLADDVGGRPVLIALDDVAALLVCRHASRLEQSFRLNVPPASLAEELADKGRLHELCLRHGIASPRRTLASRPEHVAAFVAEVGLPVVVKATSARALLSGESRSVRIAGSVEEALAAMGQTSPNGLQEVLLQAYLPGDASSVWMLNGYFDAGSTCRLAFTGHKLRQWHPDTGYTSLGVCRPNPEVEARAVALLGAVGYRGIVDLGFRLDERDGSYHLLDVNPRLGATFRLFVGRDGTDVVRALYADLTGQPVPTSSPVPGRRWLTEPQDVASALSLHRQGRLSLLAWLASYRGVQETAWLSWRDPLPAVALLVKGAREAARRRQHATSTVPVELTRRHFDRQAGWWRDVYGGSGPEAAIYGRRQARALAWVDDGLLPERARVLEVGAGAGRATLELGRRAGLVTSLDSSLSMVDQLRSAVQAAGLRRRVCIARADATALPVGDQTQDLVLALGLLPWLPDPALALAEMHRVLRDGGHLIVSADNRLRLHWRLDPLLHPGLTRVRHGLRAGLRPLGVGRSDEESVPPALHDLDQLAVLLTGAGFQVVQTYSFGFGPFTFLGRPLMPSALGRVVDGRLQSRADGQPGGRLAGVAAQHLLLCRVPSAAAREQTA